MKLKSISVGCNNSFKNIELEWNQCVAIGYAGRDQKNVLAHIEELKEIGVPTPDRIPSMYWIEPTRISTAETLFVVGEGTSGEIEFFAVRDKDNNMYFTVASDHTDRTLETISVSKAKQCCTKIISNVFWDMSEVRDHWDDIMLRSWVKESENSSERLYQEGPLSKLLPPEKLMELAVEDAQTSGPIAYFSGTLPLLGSICYGGIFRMEIEDQQLNRKIGHIYTVTVLPDRN